eukprot:gene511-905_t
MTHRESGSKLSCGVCFKIQTATINAGGWDIHIYAFSASALLVVAMVFMMYYMSTAYRRGYDQHQRTLQEFLANTEISSPHRNPLREVDSANDIDYIDPIYYGFTQAVSYTFVLQAFGYLFGRSIPYPAVTWGIMFNLANCSDNFVCIHLCRLRCRRSSGTPRSAKMSFLLSLGLTTLMTGVFLVDGVVWSYDIGYCFLDLGVLGYCLMYAPLLLYTFRADSKFMRKYHLRQALDTHGRHGASNSGGMYEAVLPEDWADSDSQEASAAVLKRLNDILKLLESSQMRFIKWDELDIGSRLGGGSFGEVFVAQWQGAQVAVKCLVDNGNGLAEVYDFLREGGSQGLTGAQRLQVLHQITAGMGFLHSFQPPILHRDLKSRNVLVDGAMRCKLCDFGHSRQQARPPIRSPLLSYHNWRRPSPITIDGAGPSTALAMTGSSIE